MNRPWRLVAVVGLALTVGDVKPAAATVIDGQTVAERTAAFLGYCAQAQPGRADYPKEAMAYYAARLILRTDIDDAVVGIQTAIATALRKSRERLAKDPNDANALDPFDRHAMLNTYLIRPDAFTPRMVADMKTYLALHGHQVWRGFGSMNYRLMKDGSGFIAAEQWPDLVDADKLNSAQIRAATGARLYGYFSTIVHRNLDEYNAPTYYPTDLMVVRMLAEYARDPEMKKRATLTLDWLMANLACAWNQGYNIATAGRSKGWGCVATSPDSSDGCAAVGWFYYGGRRGIVAERTCPHHAFWMAYPGTYRVPDIVARIASDRDRSFGARESVLSIGGCDIRKTVFQSASYGLTCQWEDAPGPESSFYKETKRQVLKWVSDKPASTFSVQQQNYLRPYRPKDITPNSFGYGENPFHQILQHENVQIGLYDVPRTYPFHKLYVPFTTAGAIVRRVEREGWIFCHGGSMLFAFRMANTPAWGKPEQGCDVLWSDQYRNGWVLETAELGPYAGGGAEAELDRFAADLLAKSSLDAGKMTEPTPSLTYITTGGHRLELVFRPFGAPYTNQHKIDGKALDYRSFPLMRNPWVHQEVDGDTLTLSHGGSMRTYDFKAWTVTERHVQ